MLKLKNKFKFGLSNHEKKNGGSSVAVNSVNKKQETSERSDLEKNYTHDNVNISKNVKKDQTAIEVKKKKKTKEQDLIGQTNIKSNKIINIEDEKGVNDMNNINSPKTVLSFLKSEISETILHPGLLTVKIYKSHKVKFPISLINDKKTFCSLAKNFNEEGDKLLKKIKNECKNYDSKEKEKSFESEMGLSYVDSGNILSGDIAAECYPSLVKVENSDKTKPLVYLTLEFDNNVVIVEPKSGSASDSVWNHVVFFDVINKFMNFSDPQCKKLSVFTHHNYINFNLFLKLPIKLIPEFERKNNVHFFSNNNNKMKDPSLMIDLLIGSIRLKLDFFSISKSGRLMNHKLLNFKTHNYFPHQEVTKKVGKLMVSIDFKLIQKKQFTIEDFDLLKVIGKGSFGKVMQVVKKDTKQIYALKTLRKQYIISRMEVNHTLAERTVLARINNPFIVPLKFCFQSPEKLYLVLSFINGGELFWHLQKEGKFSMDRSRFYAAELLSALETLHEFNVIYRDLKPENILVDYQGHIALCDFGLCKLNMSNEDKTNTFCGTPEYLAPELLLNKGYKRNVDWWTLGILLYEMLTGLPPFYDSNVPVMYRKILQNTLKFPLFLDKTDAQDLLIKLLEKDPNLRLSNASEIKQHSFFNSIDWEKLNNKSYLPPFKPNVENLLDVSNFDQNFTNEKPQDSVVNDFLTESVQKQFKGWTYYGDTYID